ncbi:MAG: hypothetical protein ACRDTC_08305 [Pseudonocardiaceae bacterium]
MRHRPRGRKFAVAGHHRWRPGLLAAAAGYRLWGWPVALRRDQILLDLDGDTVALIIPVLLAAEVVVILAQRCCPMPVLAHPCAPEHRILLVAQRFEVALSWPLGIRVINGTRLSRSSRLGGHLSGGRPGRRHVRRRYCRIR